MVQSFIGNNNEQRSIVSQKLVIGKILIKAS